MGFVIGRFLSQFFPTSLQRGVVSILIILGLVGWITYAEMSRKRKMDAAPFQGMSVNGDIGVLHIVERGATKPKNILTAIGTFDTPEAVYHNVYKRFDEAAYRKIVIHRVGKEPQEFIASSDAPEEQNQQNLRALMTA